MEVSKILYFILLSAIPIALWIFVFRKLMPTNKHLAMISFIAGMISVLPIKLYEKYWNTTLLNLEHVNLFKYLGDVVQVQAVGTLLAYVVSSVVVMVGLFVFTGVLMAILQIGSGDDNWGVFKSKCIKVLECPAFFLTLAVVCGVIGYFTSLGLSKMVWFFVMVGILEEFIKHLVLRFSDEDKITSVREAIQYSIMVALGFAFVENIIYAVKIDSAGLMSMLQLTVIISLRSVLSVGAHVGFSAILGYFYGIAKFADPIYQAQSLKHKSWFVEKVHQVMHVRQSVVFHDQKMLEGVALAMILHAAYNSFLEFNFPLIALIEILLLLTCVNILLKQKKWFRHWESLNTKIVNPFQNQVIKTNY